MNRHVVLLIVAACLAAACSSPSAKSGAGGGGSASWLAPPPAGQGVQLTMKTTILGSAEDERCLFATIDDDLWVHQEEVRYTPGSHHFILWNTSYTSVPTQDDNGNTVDTSGVFECPGGPPNGWKVKQYIGGSQAPDAPDVLGKLPSDVALHIAKGSVVMLDLHVLNPTTSPLDVTVQINLDAMPQSEVKREAGIYFFYDPFIAIPPQSSAHSRMSCPVTSDVTLTTAQTHMHKWGLGGEATLEDAAGNLLQKLYTSSTWTDPPVTQWSDPPMALHAGQQIDYQCNYQNNGSTTISQGLSAVTNEMCVFAGAYYPRDPVFETCGTSGMLGDVGSAATFIGTGSATCGASLACLAGAKGKDAATFYGCIVQSCAGVAKPLTAFVDCALKSANPVTDCATEISACEAASCT